MKFRELGYPPFKKNKNWSYECKTNTSNFLINVKYIYKKAPEVILLIKRERRLSMSSTRALETLQRAATATQAALGSNTHYIHLLCMFN